MSSPKPVTASPDLARTPDQGFFAALLRGSARVLIKIIVSHVKHLAGATWLETVEGST